MKSINAQAAAQIRTKLKAASIKASVKSASFANGSSVNIELTDADPATVERARKIGALHEYGHFDGMTDCYEYSNHQPEMPQVKFVHINVTLSPEMEQQVYDFIRSYFAGGDKLPVQYHDAQSLHFNHTWVSNFVWQQFCRADSPFWQQQQA